MASTAIRTVFEGVAVAIAASLRRGLVLRGLQLQDGSAAVEAAVRTGAVGPLGLVAVRALLELGQPQGEVRAPIPLAGMGDLALWHTHGVVELLSIAGRRELSAPGSERGVYLLSSEASTLNARRASSRGSMASSSWATWCSSSRLPHSGQRPGQPASQSGAMGSASEMASDTSGASSSSWW